MTAIADFFIHLFEVENLCPVTLKGYRTSISSVYSKIGRKDAILDKAISDLISCLALKRPKVTRTLPGWDLGLVLEHLKGKPYEPLGEADLKHVTLKTAFLLAMASGARRSELHALMYDEPYCRVEEDGSKVILYFAPGFLRKNQSPFSSDTPLKIQALPPDDSTSGAILCPVRALRYYRRATAAPGTRKGRQRLFIPFKDNNNQREISPMSISRWICSVIVEAHKEKGEEEELRQDLGVRAHEVRAVATSLVNLQGASMAEIMQAGRWASGGTFTRHYLRDLVPQANRIAQAGPIVAAGRVITLPTPSATVTSSNGST